MTPQDQFIAEYLSTITEADPQFRQLCRELHEDHPALSDQQLRLLAWTWLHLAAVELYAATEAANPGTTKTQ